MKPPLEMEDQQFWALIEQTKQARTQEQQEELLTQLLRASTRADQSL